MATVCDSCYGAMAEETGSGPFGESDPTEEEVIAFCLTRGDDIPDHPCDSMEYDDINCECACHP